MTLCFCSVVSVDLLWNRTVDVSKWATAMPDTRYTVRVYQITTAKIERREEMCWIGIEHAANSGISKRFCISQRAIYGKMTLGENCNKSRMVRQALNIPRVMRVILMHYELYLLILPNGPDGLMNRGCFFLGSALTPCGWAHEVCVCTYEVCCIQLQMSSRVNAL